MSDLKDDEKEQITIEVDQFLSTLHALTSNRLRGPSGIMIPPYRVFANMDTIAWSSGVSEYETYVFCHNDLSQQNIVVDPNTLRIRAFIGVCGNIS